MTETLSIAYLLGALAETCEARDWALYVDYDPRRKAGPWSAATSGLRGGCTGNGTTLAEALARLWAATVRHAREEATRRAG